MRRMTSSDRRWFTFLAFLVPFIAIMVERNLEFPTIINPDGVNYAIIAKEYSNGRVHKAVNGYWGPAISWLMAIPIIFGIDPLISFRIVNGLAVLGVVAATGWLSTIGGFTYSLRFVALWTSGLLSLGWSLTVMTPDLLMVMVVILFAGHFFLLNAQLVPSRMAALGIIGGVAFLVKPFGFTFFALVYPIILLYALVRYHGELSIRSTLLKGMTGLGSFAVVVLPWLLALRWKYGHFTIGSSGPLNLSLVAPTGSEWVCRPARPEGLQVPPYKGAVACLDPSVPESPTWSPTGSIPDFEHLVRNWFDNVAQVIDRFSLTLFVLGGVVIIAQALLLRRRGNEPEFAIRAATIAVPYVALYCLVVLNDRYLWPAILLGCLGAFSLVNAVTSATCRSGIALNILVLPLVLILIAGPLWRPSDGLGRDFMTAQYRLVESRAQVGDRATRDADVLRSSYGGKTIASTPDGGRWLYAAFMINSTYYGFVTDEMADDAVRRFLSEQKVEVFLHWGDQDAKPAYLADYEPTDEFYDGWLTVYVRR